MSKLTLINNIDMQNIHEPVESGAASIHAKTVTIMITLLGSVLAVVS